MECYLLPRPLLATFSKQTRFLIIEPPFLGAHEPNQVKRKILIIRLKKKRSHSWHVLCFAFDGGAVGQLVLAFMASVVCVFQNFYSKNIYYFGK